MNFSKFWVNLNLYLNDLDLMKIIAINLYLFRDVYC